MPLLGWSEGMLMRMPWPCPAGMVRGHYLPALIPPLRPLLLHAGWPTVVQDLSRVQERGPPKSITVEDSFKSCRSWEAVAQVCCMWGSCGGECLKLHCCLSSPPGCWGGFAVQCLPSMLSMCYARPLVRALMRALMQVVAVLAPDLMVRLQEDEQEHGRRPATLVVKWRHRAQGMARSSASCHIPLAALGLAGARGSSCGGGDAGGGEEEAARVAALRQAAVQLLRRQLPGQFDLTLISIGATGFGEGPGPAAGTRSITSMLAPAQQAQQRREGAEGRALPPDVTEPGAGAAGVPLCGGPGAGAAPPADVALGDLSGQRRRDYGSGVQGPLLSKQRERQLREQARQEQQQCRPEHEWPQQQQQASVWESRIPLSLAEQHGYEGDFWGDEGEEGEAEGVDRIWGDLQALSATGRRQHTGGGRAASAAGPDPAAVTAGSGWASNEPPAKRLRIAVPPQPALARASQALLTSATDMQLAWSVRRQGQEQQLQQQTEQQQQQGSQHLPLAPAALVTDAALALLHGAVGSWEVTRLAVNVAFAGDDAGSGSRPAGQAIPHFLQPHEASCPAAQQPAAPPAAPSVAPAGRVPGLQGRQTGAAVPGPEPGRQQNQMVASETSVLDQAGSNSAAARQPASPHPGSLAPPSGASPAPRPPAKAATYRNAEAVALLKRGAALLAGGRQGLQLSGGDEALAEEERAERASLALALQLQQEEIRAAKAGAVVASGQQQGITRKRSVQPGAQLPGRGRGRGGAGRAGPLDAFMRRRGGEC